MYQTVLINLSAFERNMKIDFFYYLSTFQSSLVNSYTMIYRASILNENKYFKLKFNYPTQKPMKW